MNELTYKEAYDKIITAYFRDEIEPYNRRFCFCGTLAWSKERADEWSMGNWDYSFYNADELRKMEHALLETIRDETIGKENCPSIFIDTINKSEQLREEVRTHPNYEIALFNGMAKALVVLKQIHISRGENVDDVPEFTKRELLKAE